MVGIFRLTPIAKLEILALMPVILSPSTEATVNRNFSDTFSYLAAGGVGRGGNIEVATPKFSVTNGATSAN